MVDSPILILKLLLILGCSLIADVFFAFSSFVMKALARLQPPQDIAAMQSINIVVINPLFMTVFLVTAILSLILIFYSLYNWYQPDAIYLLVGSLLYLVGTFLVTIIFNVPLNDALANVQANSSESASVWANYLDRWTMWNHIRTTASLGATRLLTLSLCY
jgi:uncharacterized membrane protein